MNELIEIDSSTDASETELFSPQHEEQYLSFTLGNELFAVKILNVQEIRTWEQPTPLPRSPNHIKGVINLRGTIMPIMDLRIKLELCEPHYDDTTVVIILKAEQAGKMRSMGVVVDAMTDVFHVPEDKVKPAPEFGGKVDATYIDGLAMINDSIVSILNTSAVIDTSAISHAY